MAKQYPLPPRIPAARPSDGGETVAASAPTPIVRIVPDEPLAVVPAGDPDIVPGQPLAVWYGILLIAAIGLAALGQSIFWRLKAFSWNAFAATMAAIVLFMLVDGRVIRRFGWGRRMSQRQRNPDNSPVAVSPWRALALVLACALAAGTVYGLSRMPETRDYNWTLLTWLGGMAAYFAAIAPWRRGTIPKTAQPRWVWPALLAIVLVAGALRFWQLDAIPQALGGDEGSQGHESIRVLRGEIQNPFSTGWVGVPTMSFYYNAWGIALLGNNVWGLRVPWTLIGVLTMIPAYFLVARLKGHTMALLSTSLLATYHFHIHFSRLGSVQVTDSMFVILTLLFIYRGYQRQSLVDWTLAGFVMASAQYFYAGARFTPLIAAFVLGSLFIRSPRQFVRDHGKGIMVLLGATLIASGPIIHFALRFPDQYNDRINSTGIFQSGWLAREVVARNQPAWSLLLMQFRQAVFAFNAYPDRIVWYGAYRPLLDGVAGTIFLLGLGYATLRFWDKSFTPMLGWWWGGIISGSMLTVDTPQSQRLTGLALPTVFFISLALVRIGQSAQQIIGTRRGLWIRPALALMVCVISFFSIRWYFVEYTPMRIYGAQKSYTARLFAEYAQKAYLPNGDWNIYFFGPPDLSAGYGTIIYLLPDMGRQDVTDVLSEPPPPAYADASKNALFAFMPHRHSELTFVQQTFPGGTLTQVNSPYVADPNPLWLVYSVPRELIAAAQAPAGQSNPTNASSNR